MEETEYSTHGPEQATGPSQGAPAESGDRMAALIREYNQIDEQLAQVDKLIFEYEAKSEKIVDALFEILEELNELREAAGEYKIQIPLRRGNLEQFIPKKGQKYRELKNDLLILLERKPGSTVDEIIWEFANYGEDETDGITHERILQQLRDLVSSDEVHCIRGKSGSRWSIIQVVEPEELPLPHDAELGLEPGERKPLNENLIKLAILGRLQRGNHTAKANTLLKHLSKRVEFEGLDLEVLSDLLDQLYEEGQIVTTPRGVKLRFPPTTPKRRGRPLKS